VKTHLTVTMKEIETETFWTWHQAV